MIEIPTLEQLREKFRDVMANPAVTSVSNWTLPNEDTPTDEAEYVENVNKSAPDILARVDKALEKMKP